MLPKEPKLMLLRCCEDDLQGSRRACQTPPRQRVPREKPVKIQLRFRGPQALPQR